MPSPIRLLIVDDDPRLSHSLSAWFTDEGYEVSTAADGEEALERVLADGADVLLVDIKMPRMDGLELQRRLARERPAATVIIMTAFGEVGTAVRAMKEGAYDYIVKPFEPEAMSRLVRKAAERQGLRRENRQLKERLEAEAPTLVTAGVGPMAEVLEQIALVAPTTASVLVTGESGTGKELVARRIVAASERAFAPLIVVNCGALAEGVLESELFGHEKGAFTGAGHQRKGRLEEAHRGTLFLDEIGDVPPKVQIDLLRVLEEHQLRRVGGNQEVEVDFRLLCATHRDLEAMVEEGSFRQDLYFRIDVFRIRLPPLRDRPGDVALLAGHFLERFSRQMSRRAEGFSDEALALLCSHRWPGNVRELQNVIERAVVLCPEGRIEARHLPFGEDHRDLTLAGIEAAHLERVLAGCGNVTQAARILGIDRTTLYAKMKRYGLRRGEP
ncbi:MAG: sigma-54 dependent transcriptional regulator [Deltaproteobacteria bacterium]|nr:sigma-54 dependent transcriptional regulator [Deltaproteobacteria bacterium]